MNKEFLRDGKPAGTLVIKGLSAHQADTVARALKTTVEFFADAIEEVRLPPTIEQDESGHSVRFRCWLKEKRDE